jgi:hypothetical protein
MARRWWPIVRTVWATTGSIAGIVFVGWSVLAFRANADAQAALKTDDRVVVTETDGFWTFRPQAAAAAAGLVFFPGGMVDPVAYAPIVRRMAEHGYPSVLVRVPRRGAFGGADGPEVFDRARQAMAAVPAVQRWVVAGHSRGGVIAANAVRIGLPRLAALVLIGTTHPRDFSLAATPLPVTRVYGTRDTVADVEKMDATRPNLPAATTMVRIDGGNHSQFGYYGFQPGDWPATIARAEQQAITQRAILDALAGRVP